MTQNCQKGVVLTAKRLGFWVGALAFVSLLLLPVPAGMPAAAWRTLAVLVLMAIWWMTQALPLSATALLPFLLFPLLGVMGASDTASTYYSPVLFLFLGGSIIALAVERVGLHRRVALAIVARSGGTASGLLLSFMIATASISLFISNTATALIMMPMAIAVLRAADVHEGHTGGFAGALVMGVAFAATIGGFGTLVGSPTNAIAAGIVERTVGLRIGFLTWTLYGLPLVLFSIPLCWLILLKVQKVVGDDFDVAKARTGIANVGHWTSPERRLLPLLVLTVIGWLAIPYLADALPSDALTDGSIAIGAALALFFIPDGTGRPLLTWEEANRAPWAVILMFGGGLALAAAVDQSGLAQWIGSSLRWLDGVPTLVLALVLVAGTIFITEFASNVGAASGAMPVVAGLIAAFALDPILLALPAAFAASWGFMLPSGTGPNAIAWGTGHVALPRMLRAGFMLDLAGVPLLVGSVWLLRGVIS